MLTRHDKGGYNTANTVKMHLQVIETFRSSLQTTTSNQNDVFFRVLLLRQNASRAEFFHCMFTNATCHRAGVQHALKMYAVVDKDRSIEQLTESLDLLCSLNDYSGPLGCFSTAVLI